MHAERPKIRLWSRSNRNRLDFLNQQLSKKLETEANLIKGLDQYAYHKFAKAFEVFAKILAENAGLNINEMIPKLLAANEKEISGLDIIVKNNYSEWKNREIF